jgi:hypothetical protein
MRRRTSTSVWPSAAARAISCLQHDLPLGDVLAGRPNVGAAFQAGRQDDLAGLLDPHVFLHEDRVGPGRHRRAGEDTDGPAWHRGMVGGRAGLDPVGDGKGLLLADRQILAAQRIAVDGGIGEGRQRQRRREILCQDAAIRLDEWDRFAAFDHAQPRGEQGGGVLDRQHRSTEGKAIIRQLRHCRNIVLFCVWRATAGGQSER